MDKIIILFIVLMISAFLVILARKERLSSGHGQSIYQYSIGVRSILFICILIMSTLMIIEYVDGNIQNSRDFMIWIAILTSSLSVWAFFQKTKVYITDSEIVKDTPFWKTKIAYDEVKKIRIYRSTGNPGAAMTKVYGNKKITLEAMLVGYEELIDELQHRCRQAEVIDK